MATKQAYSPVGFSQAISIYTELQARMDKEESSKFKDIWPWLLISIYVIGIIFIAVFYYQKVINIKSNDKALFDWHDLLFGIAGLWTAIIGFFYSSIRIHRAEKYNEKQDAYNKKQEQLRREDKLTQRYEEALRNLYTTDKEDLQLLGVRELYNTYKELTPQSIIEKLTAQVKTINTGLAKILPGYHQGFKDELQLKILDSVFEYLREISVRNTTHQDKVVNKIFDLFLKDNFEFPGGYQINLEGMVISPRPFHSNFENTYVNYWENHGWVAIEQDGRRILTKKS